MSQLVTDFLVNPVLRQARRFSRSSDQAESTTHRHHTNVSNVVPGDVVHGGKVVEDVDASAIMRDGTNIPYAISDRSMVSSPVEEDGGLDSDLAEGLGTSEGISESISRAHSLPLRMMSLRSDHAFVDDDVSNNPSYVSHHQFRNDSPMSSSYSGTLRNATESGNAELEAQRRSGSETRHRDSSLPEDDGMKEMRRKVVAIQSMDIDAAQKARMMHQLLTEDYAKANYSHSKVHLRDLSPASQLSRERQSTPGSISSFSFWPSSESAPESSSGSAGHFKLTAEDLRPTFAPPKSRDVKDEADEVGTIDPPDTGEESIGELAELSLGCQHYRRNVKMQCSMCNHWYTCRFCHDESEDHTLNRKETKNMLCMLCGCAQKAGDTCIECGVRSAWYYCSKCKLWDDDISKSIYHCDDCGICRVGAGLGKDYMHCKICGVCILISKEHKCIERASDCDCPICGEYLFNSPQTVVFMRCGHTIHQVCYKELMKTSYKCPLCSQSVVNMETQFRNLDRAIESQPMPPGFQDTQAMISCNDCYAKSIVKYHWLGLKCAVCDSYNTAQLQIMSDAIQQPISGPAEEDIIPGPRADLFLDSMHRREATAVAARADRERERNSLAPGPTRVRRHSHGHGGSSEQASRARFNPYPPPPRVGRSVSPARGPGLRAVLHSAFVDFGGGPAQMDAEESEDELDFWGGEVRRRPSHQDLDDISMDGSDNEEDEEDDSDDESLEDEEEEEDGDEVSRMDLFGHR